MTPPAPEEAEAPKPRARRSRARKPAAEAEVAEATPEADAPAEPEVPAAEAPSADAPDDAEEQPRRRARPRRHTKPQLTRPADETYVRLLAGVGTASGVEVADLVSAVTKATGLDGEAVRDVQVLTRFALLSVPESEADRVVSDLDGVQVRGAQLRVALARS